MGKEELNALIIRIQCMQREMDDIISRLRMIPVSPSPPSSDPDEDVSDEYTARARP